VLLVLDRGVQASQSCGLACPFEHEVHGLRSYVRGAGQLLPSMRSGRTHPRPPSSCPGSHSGGDRIGGAHLAGFLSALRNFSGGFWKVGAGGNNPGRLGRGPRPTAERFSTKNGGFLHKEARQEPRPTAQLFRGKWRVLPILPNGLEWNTLKRCERVSDLMPRCKRMANYMFCWRKIIRTT
jgi:hypothetical protein